MQHCGSEHDYTGVTGADWQEARQSEPRIKPNCAAFTPAARQCKADDAVLVALEFMAQVTAEQQGAH